MRFVLRAAALAAIILLGAAAAAAAPRVVLVIVDGLGPAQLDAAAYWRGARAAFEVDPGWSATA